MSPTVDKSMLHPASADYPRIERALNDREWISEWRVEHVMDFDGRAGEWYEGRFAIQRRFDYKRYVDDGKPPLKPGDQFEPEIHVEVTARTYEQVVETFWNILESTKASRNLDSIRNTP